MRTSSLRYLLTLEVEMRCNACWRELEGRAVSTSCGHLLCNPISHFLLVFNTLSWWMIYEKVLKMPTRFSLMMGHVPFVNKYSPRGEIFSLALLVLLPTWQFIFVFYLSLMKPVDTNPNEEWINVSACDEVDTIAFRTFPALSYFHLTSPHFLPLLSDGDGCNFSANTYPFCNCTSSPSWYKHLGISCSYVLHLNSLSLCLKSKLKCSINWLCLLHM